MPAGALPFFKTYTHPLFDDATADELYKQLGSIEWLPDSKTAVHFGKRTVNVPRKQQVYATQEGLSYRFSGTELLAQMPMPDCVRAVLDKASQFYGCEWNFALINKYVSTALCSGFDRINLMSCLFVKVTPTVQSIWEIITRR